MKIFVLLANFPYERGEAIEVVGFEAIRLMAAGGHTLDVQVLLRDGRTPRNVERERYARESLGKLEGVALLDAICLNELEPPRGRFSRSFELASTWVRSLPVLRRSINDRLFPGRRAYPLVRDAVRRTRPDIILGIWTWESLAATSDIRDVPKFMYYGNPDHKPTEARLDHPELFGIDVRTPGGWLRHRYLRRLNKAREIQHVKMSKTCAVMANNSLVDVNYYRDAGHPRSVYIQNMWPAPDGRNGAAAQVARDETVSIIGSVGNLGATGNTFGLHYIGQHIAPGMRRRMGNRAFSIDIFGGGRPTAAVEKVLVHPAIRLRGWVDDINSEILRAAAFLVLTNVSGFIVGNTRILLAWSLGSCVIAHRNSALSMPEIQHMENALLGETPDEINDLIYRAIEDPQLRQRIGAGGYATYQKYYRSEVVVPQMLEEMGKCVTSQT